jgi:hypothetical protein
LKDLDEKADRQTHTYADQDAMPPDMTVYARQKCGEEKTEGDEPQDIDEDVRR